MVVCWSVGGGVGVSVVSAALALTAMHAGEPVVVIDLGGDQPVLFGAADPPGPGVAEWTRSGPEVGGAALGRLEAELVPGISLLPRGSGPLDPARAEELARWADDGDRFVVVDAGPAVADGFAEALVRASARTLLVARACPLSLRRIEQLAVRPTEVVVVRDRRRAVAWHQVADAAGAPVVAELEIDPMVAAAVDAGLERRALPRRFLRVVDGVR